MDRKTQSNSILFINDNEYEVDEQGFLMNISDWSREVAEGIAAKDGIELESEHWEVIMFLRDCYFEYQIAPAIRVLSRGIGNRLGIGEGNTRYLNQLFAFGPAIQACRYAGLPKPTGCI
ncbi:MAG: TusE/DsrC/DsvC family sulfur relay protein [Gammaproteobacteria bacterium]|nr:TusE/DsrC/DsvC family sulfur relay protein [Gammaproteobacteria bacterium]